MTDDPKAALWDALTKAGLDPDSATKAVTEAAARKMSNADAFDLYVNRKQPGGSATSRAMAKQNAIVQANPLDTDVLDTQGRVNQEPGAMSDTDQAITAGGDHLVNSLALGQGRRIAALTAPGSYAANSARFKQSLEQDRIDHPGASLTGDLLGIVGNPLNAALPGAAAETGLTGDALAAAKAANVARNVKIGAGIGAVTSVGDSADDPVSLVKAALFGGATGAVGGYLVPKILAPAAKLLGLGVDQVASMFRSGNPTSAARAAVARAVEQEGGIAAVRAKMAANGPQGRFMDVGPATRALADQTATQSPTAQAAITDMTATRQAGQSSRVVQALNGDDTPQSAKMIIKGYRDANIAQGNTDFPNLRERFPDLQMGDDFNKAMTLPGMQNQLNKLSLPDDLDGRNAVNTTKNFLSYLAGDNINDAKSLGLTEFIPEADRGKPGVSYTAVSNFRNWLTDQISKAMARTATKTPNIALADALRNVQYTVDDAIAEHPVVGPLHADAVSKYAIGARLTKAATQGAQDMTHGDATDIPANMARIAAKESTPAAREAALTAYKKAAIGALSKMARSVGKATDLSKVFGPGSSDEMAIKARAILGADYPVFAEKMAQESRLALARGTGQGSQTAKRLAQGAIVAGSGYELAKHPAAIPYAAGAAALMAGAAGARTQAANEVLPYLMHTGPDAIEDLLNSYLPRAGTAPSAAAVGGAMAPPATRSLLDQ